MKNVRRRASECEVMFGNHEFNVRTHFHHVLRIRRRRWSLRKRKSRRRDKWRFMKLNSVEILNFPTCPKSRCAVSCIKCIILFIFNFILLGAAGMSRAIFNPQSNVSFYRAGCEAYLRCSRCVLGSALRLEGRGSAR